MASLLMSSLLLYLLSIGQQSCCNLVDPFDGFAVQLVMDLDADVDRGVHEGVYIHAVGWVVVHLLGNLYPTGKLL